MPHSLSPVVIAAAVAELVGLLFAAAVLAGLRQVFPRPYMRSWSWSWLAAATGVALGVVVAMLMPLPPLARTASALAIVLLYYLQAAWLLLGVRELESGVTAPLPLRRATLWAPPLLALASTLPALLGSPLPVRSVLRYILPAATLALCALYAAGRVARRPTVGPRTGVRLMAGALALYGLVDAHDVVLQVRALLGADLPGYPAYSGFVEVAILTVFALGAVVALLDEERARLVISEEKFARVFRFSPDVIAVTLPREGGRIVDVNERFEQLTGHGREEAVGRTAVDLGLFVEPTDRTAIWEESQDGVVRDREVRFRMKDGEERVFSLAAETFVLEGRDYGVIVARDMTDRLRAAAELRAGEERLRLTLEAAGMSTWEWDVASGEVRWSEGAEAIFRVGREQLPRALESYLRLVHPGDREGFRQRLRGALAGRVESFFEESRVVDEDGRIRWLEGRGRIQREASGRAVLVRGTVADVTARKEAERELRESEERFRRLAAASFEGVAMSEDGMVIDVNEQLAEMLGCSVSHLVGRPIRDFVAAGSQELVRARLADASGEPYQHVARRADGSELPVEVRARTVPYGGRTVRLSAVRDMSERVEAETRQRRLEDELRQAAEEWRQTFDALDLGILLVNPQGTLVRLNRRALELAERASFDSVIGRGIDELSAAEPWRALAGHRAELGSGRASIGSEVRDPATSRSYYVLASSWPREDGRPPWSVLTFRDVTDYVAVQEQLRKARLMETMGSLVAGVAHEVRNPLFSISATVDAMEAGFRSQPEFGEHAEVLRSQVVRLTRLMRDLLDYGKPSLLQRTPGHIADVVRRAARSCAGLAGAREVRIEADLADDLPKLQIDAAHLEQACENLVSNAILHAPKGSVVGVRARYESHGSPPCVRLTVEDEGPGLEIEHLARVFEPFFTRRAGGTGLGLSIVQRVVEAHGGEVTARNRPKRGACFTIKLPVSTEMSSRA